MWSMIPPQHKSLGFNVKKKYFKLIVQICAFLRTSDWTSIVVKVLSCNYWDVLSALWIYSAANSQKLLVVCEKILAFFGPVGNSFRPCDQTEVQVLHMNATCIYVATANARVCFSGTEMLLTAKWHWASPKMFHF